MLIRAPQLKASVRHRVESEDEMVSYPHRSLRGGHKAPAVFFASSLLLMVATIVFSNYRCWGGCSFMPLGLWYWAGPIKLSGVLVVAAALLMLRHPLAYLAAILVSSYAVYDVSLGVYEAWRSFSGMSVERIGLWRVVYIESLLPVWRGLLRGVLGTVILIYAAIKLFRPSSSGSSSVR
jgi:hypothetical protein